MNLAKVFNFLNPRTEIGGLKISDLNLRYVRIKGDNLITASLRMPPDIVKEGKVKDREKLIKALKELHSQIVKNPKKKISVIVAIPDDNVYIQIFDLPAAASTNFEEAAKLNLQMISPIDFNSAYSDWQLAAEAESNGQQGVLGAFIQKDIVDEFEYCLKEAGFVVAAIECPAFSLSRLAVELGANALDQKNVYILLQFSTNGLGFNVIKKNNFRFNHFVSWQSIYGDKREILFDDFKNTVINEIQRVLKFYEVHWSGQIGGFLLVSPESKEEISQIIYERFNVPVQTLALRKFGDLEPVWFSALGSALRGLIPRSKDTLVSLASVGTEKEFERQQVIGFVKIWRNIVIAVFSLIIVVFAAVDIFAIKTVSFLDSQLAVSVGQPEAAELDKYREEARIFNKKVGLALSARRESADWSPFFEKILDLTGEGVIIDRIFIQSLETPVLISGRAGNEEAAINFRKALSEQPQFENVDLPLTSLTPAAGGVNFSISFKIKNLQF